MILKSNRRKNGYGLPHRFNMDQPGLLARSATALAQKGINIKSCGFALRKVNIQFLIAREDLKKLLKR